MEAMNEKKQFFIDSFPDKAKEIVRRLAFTPNVGVGQIIVQKRPGYIVIQNKKVPVHKGKKIMGSTNTTQEERPDEPTPKRHKIMEEERSQVERYSPTQSPLRIGEEQFTSEQVEQIGS